MDPKTSRPIRIVLQPPNHGNLSIQDKISWSQSVHNKEVLLCICMLQHVQLSVKVLIDSLLEYCTCIYSNRSRGFYFIFLARLIRLLIEYISA